MAEETVPRRESLRRLGFALDSAVLSPFGLQTAFAGKTDPCKSFCKCRNKRQQDQCLKACTACGKDTSRLAGSCGGYSCCGAGQTSCGSYCTTLASDVYNCGACGNVCGGETPFCYEGACIGCSPELALCDNACIDVGWDANNCGACGNVCGGSNPYCNQGECSPCWPGGALCDGQCVDLTWNASHCGACGNVCPPQTGCSFGVCHGVCIDCY